MRCQAWRRLRVNAQLLSIDNITQPVERGFAKSCGKQVRFLRHLCPPGVAWLRWAHPSPMSLQPGSHKMNDLSKRVPLDRTRYPISQAFFVAKLAFYVFFVIPSMILGGVLALYSNFSFETIPREVLQFAAQTATNPPARPGSLSIEVCKDKVPAHALPASPICQSKSFEQRPIEALATELGNRLWWSYAIVVFLSLGLAMVLGPFRRDRDGCRRRRAS